jgi:DNA repair protein RadC
MIKLGSDIKVTEVELIYVNKMEDLERPKITTSLDAFEVLYNSWDKGKLELQEQFKIMLLDRKNSCLGVSTVATGGVSSCLVDLRLAFATALKARATAIILAHNHPSGNPKQSEDDERLTAKFFKAGQLLDITILDHIVVTRNGYTSFSDNGLLPAMNYTM